MKCQCGGKNCRLEADDARHGEPTGYFNGGCRCTPCKRAANMYRSLKKERRTSQLDLIIEALAAHRPTNNRRTRCRCGAALPAGDASLHTAKMVSNAVLGTSYGTERPECEPATLQTIQIHRALGEALCGPCAALLGRIMAGDAPFSEHSPS